MFINYSFGIQNEAVKRLLGFCQENKLVLTNILFQQRDNSMHQHYEMINSKIRVITSLEPKMEKLYTVSKTGPGANYNSDHKLLITKFRLKMKKVGETTRSFRYDLSQILYD